MTIPIDDEIIVMSNSIFLPPIKTKIQCFKFQQVCGQIQLVDVCNVIHRIVIEKILPFISEDVEKFATHQTTKILKGFSNCFFFFSILEIGIT